ACARVSGSREGQMRKLGRTVSATLFVFMPVVAAAGPAEEANAIVDRWSTAYSSNDPDAIVKTYTPDAILLGTVSPIISEGSEAIYKYFAPSKGKAIRTQSKKGVQSCLAMMPSWSLVSISSREC